MKRGLILTLIAFLGGLGVMGWAVTSWPPARELIVQKPERLAASPAPTLPPASITPQAEDGRIAALEARIDQIQSLGSGSGGGTTSARAEGLLIAFAARRAVDRGLALGYLEGALQQHFGGAQPRAVGIVIAAARNPVTIDQLKDQLIAVGPKLVSGTRDKGWVESMQEGLSSLIIVRKAGTPSSNPVERLARAQHMVDAGRIDVALVEVARLPGAAHGANWMRDARRLSETHRALDVLEAAAIMQPGTTLAPKVLAPLQPPVKPVLPPPPQGRDELL